MKERVRVGVLNKAYALVFSTTPTGEEVTKMKSTIFGSGINSVITLYRIHNSNVSFKKDTNTTHSQVKLIQQALNNLGYNCGTSDGIYGSNTVSGVKAFQSAYGLTSDGNFGPMSFAKLEELLGGNHLDTTNCQNSADTGAYGCHDTVYNQSGKTYKVSNAMRIKARSDALSRIYSYTGDSDHINVQTVMSRLEEKASILSLSYSDMDCAAFAKYGRNNKGASGSTTEFAQHLKFFGSISDIGGYTNLIPGMELFQAYRKTSSSSYFYSWHVGIYAGMHDFGSGSVPAIYQSSPSYPSLQKKYNKQSGPNLTSMSSAWNYWGWSKYITLQ